jgi:hypothetical protein
MLSTGEAEAKRRSAWRRGHGAVFFVFMWLVVIVAAFTLFGDLNLLRVISEARMASQTEMLKSEGLLE